MTLPTADRCSSARIRSWASLAPLVASALLYACDPDGHGDDDELPVVDVEERLHSGTDDVSFAYDGVVVVGDETSWRRNALGTGTLITDSYVLTAASAVGLTGGLQAQAWHTMDPLPIRIGPHPDAPKYVGEAVQFMFAGYRAPYTDMVLLKLARPVPRDVATPIVPMTRIPTTGPIEAWLRSQTFTAAGYHVLEGSTVPNPRLAETRLIAPSTVEHYPAPALYDGHGVMLVQGPECFTVDWHDSGGPLLWRDPGNQILYTLGVPYAELDCLGHYLPTFGTGEGVAPEGGPPPNFSAWLESTIPVDFIIDGPMSFGCTGSGGSPTVLVPVKNQGLTPGRAWVDIFVGHPQAPQIGTVSTIYSRTSVLSPGQRQLVSIAIPTSWQNRTEWVEVLLDTTRSVNESSESNNYAAVHSAIPDCSFN